MNIENIISNIIAPEANHLLIEPPEPNNSGWFCHEHATVLSNALSMLGFESKIIFGDVSVLIPTTPRVFITTTQEPIYKHYWCSSNIFPVADISLSLKYFPSTAKLDKPVLDFEKNGDFQILSTDSDDLSFLESEIPLVVYRKLEESPTMKLHNDDEILSAKIACHIVDIIKLKKKSLVEMDQDSALESLQDKYSNALELVKTKQ